MTIAVDTTTAAFAESSPQPYPTLKPVDLTALFSSSTPAPSPLVTLVGFGIGSAVSPGSNGSSTRNRTVGLASWLGGIPSGASYFQDCSTWLENDLASLYLVAAEDVSVSSIPNYPDFNGGLKHGAQVPGASEAFPYYADSGGPMIVGRTPLTPPLKGLVPAQIDGKQYVAGVVSTIYIDSVVGGTHPGGTYVPMNNPETGIWLLDALHDADGDGIPDRADPCPNSLDNDADRDGVCAPPDGNDNCPLVAQKLFSNSNIEVEKAVAPDKIWGDVCDPVPSPDHEFSYVFHDGASPYYTLNEIAGIRVTGRAPHLPEYTFDQTGDAVVPDPATTKTPLSAVQTYLRYCDNKKPASLLPLPCFHPSVLADEQAALRLCPTCSVANEPLNSYFHRTYIDAGGLQTAEGGIPAEYDDTTPTFLHWYAANTAVFLRKIGYLPSPPFGSPLVLDGVTWMHADSTYGSSASSNPNPDLGVHGAGLANVLRAVSSFRDENGHSFTPSILDFSCSACPNPEFQPGGTWVWVSNTVESSDLPHLGWREGETILVARAGDAPAVLAHDGRLRGIPLRVGTALSAAMADAGVFWASAAEPVSQIGTKNPVAVGLRRDGTAIVQQIRIENGVALVEADRPRRTAALGGPRTNAGPSPRHGHVAVYSRGLGVVFIVGGTRIGETAPSGELWASDLTGYWQQLPTPGVGLGDVEAATYSFPEHSLYIVDRTGHAPHLRRRLVRVSLRGGGAAVVGDWPTVLRNDRIWLNGDQGGDGLVLTCSGKGHTHTVLQIRTRGGPPRVTLARRGQGVVPVSPIVDGGGYTLVTTVHPPSLVPTRIASLSDLPDLGDEPDNGEEQDDGDETDHPNGHGLGQVQKCLR